MPEWGLAPTDGGGLPGNYNVLSAFVIEAVMTFLFIFVILGTTSKFGNSAMAGLAIGVTLMLIPPRDHPGDRNFRQSCTQPRACPFSGGKALAQLWPLFRRTHSSAVIAALVWKFRFDKE